MRAYGQCNRETPVISGHHKRHYARRTRPIAAPDIVAGRRGLYSGGRPAGCSSHNSLKCIMAKKKSRALIRSETTDRVAARPKDPDTHKKPARKQRNRAPSSADQGEPQDSFPIVGIGASAGGLSA